MTIAVSPKTAKWSPTLKCQVARAGEAALHGISKTGVVGGGRLEPGTYESVNAMNESLI